MHVQAADAERIDRGAAGQSLGRARPGQFTAWAQRTGRGSNRSRDSIARQLIAGGTIWCRMASTVFTRPVKPAASSVCPTLALTLPIGILWPGGKPAAEGFGQGLQLGGIADLGRGGMGFEVLQPRACQCRARRPVGWPAPALLARRPKAFAAAVGRHADAADHGLDFVSVGQGPGNGLDDHRHVAFGENQAVGVGVEGTRTTRAERLGVRKQDQRVGLAIRCAADDRPCRSRPCCKLAAAMAKACSDDAQAASTTRKGPVKPKPREINLAAASDDSSNLPLAPDAGDSRRTAAIISRISSSRSAAGSERSGSSSSEQMSHLADAAAIGHLGRQRRSGRVTDEDAGIAQRQVEGIEPGLAAGRGGHFAKRQMGDVGRSDLLIGQGASRAVERAARNESRPGRNRSCSAAPFSDGNAALDRAGRRESRRCRCRPDAADPRTRPGCRRRANGRPCQ